MRLFSALKSAIISEQRKPRRVLFGIFRGIKLELSLRNQLQTYLGLFEHEIQSWTKTLSRGIKTAIDIGAAEGEYTLFFLLDTNAENVYAFEPSSHCLEIFARNTQLNNIATHSRNLHLSNSLVGRHDGDTVVTLDSLANSINSPCLIKMDVDGSEEDILLGASSLNSRSGVRWLIETHSPDLENACIHLLKTAGFETKIIEKAWWRVIIPERRPIPHNRWVAAWKTEVDH